MERMRQFRFEGNSIEEIHGWMLRGAGVRGVATAVHNLEGLAKDLQHSQESLRKALQEIGVGWEGAAGDGAGSSVNESETWSVEATPVVDESTASTQSVGHDFAATRSRMPTPQEAQLSAAEHAAAQLVPIVGPIVDRALADARRDQVTNEARQRMEEWQQSANGSVDGVRPLPPVPQPVVDAAPTNPVGADVVNPTGSSRPVTSLPGGTPPTSPGSPPPLITGTPPIGRVPGGPPLPPGQTPPVGPNPVVQPPIGQPPIGQQPVRPGGPGFLPLPLGGVGPGGTAEGRRRAFGPGMYSSDDIARARGTGGASSLKGAAPDGPEATRAGLRAGPGAVAEGVPGRAAAAAASSAAGRGGSLMQPAVGGAGSRGEDDEEHTDKYADKTDEHFTDGIQRVAPPVIGG